MNRYPILTFILLALISLSGCQTEKRYEFLEGKWKVEIEGHTQFECWDVVDGKFVGHSYEMIDGEKVVFENMTIEEEGDEVYLVPTVKDQNDGRGIKFKLNSKENEWLSFENHEHDFPNVIRYLEVSDTELKVEVLGDNEDGFKMLYEKQ